MKKNVTQALSQFFDDLPKMRIKPIKHDYPYELQAKIYSQIADFYQQFHKTKSFNRRNFKKYIADQLQELLLDFKFEGNMMINCRTFDSMGKLNHVNFLYSQKMQ